MSQDISAMANFLLNNLRRPAELYNSVGPTLNELSFGLLGESFVPERDIGDFSGRVVFVTGGISLPSTFPRGSPALSSN